MIAKIKRWYYYNGQYVLRVMLGLLIAGTIFVTLAASILFALVLTQANTYKFNCNLSHRPDLYTTFFIGNGTYDYNPELFCNTLREKMHK
jgi:hypothetical protein